MHDHRNEVSIFQLIDRNTFNKFVEKYDMDKGTRSFKTWEMTSVLIASMVLGLDSYREIEGTLGIAKSTLSDAMSTRFHGFFQELCNHVLLQIRGLTHDRRVKRGIREILAIDSSECQVHGSMFERSTWKAKNTLGQAACKLHTVYSVDGDWVDDFKVTGVRNHDSPMSLQLALQSKKMYVFDKAYTNRQFWLKIIKIKSHFVTRLPSYLKIRTLEQDILHTKTNIAVGVLYDNDYQPSDAELKRHPELKSIHLRHVIYRDPAGQKIFHFLTSDRDSLGEDIAKTYKRRWAVELLYRWLKGRLDIRYLALKNPNGIKTQLTIAVLIQLLLRLKKALTKFTGTLWELLRQIRMQTLRTGLVYSLLLPDCRWNRPPINNYQTQPV